MCMPKCMLVAQMRNYVKYINGLCLASGGPRRIAMITTFSLWRYDCAALDEGSPSSRYHTKHIARFRSPPSASRCLKCSANDRRPSATKSNFDKKCEKSARATVAVCSTRSGHGSDVGTDL